MADVLRVKICGLTRREDVLMAADAGADYVGVVLSGGFLRSVDKRAAAELVAGVGATPVAVLVDEGLDAAVAAAEAMGAGVLQLHGEEPPEVVEELRNRGGWKVWKAVRVREPQDLSRAVQRYGTMVDALLVEGWKEGVVGGGGARADLEALQSVRRDVAPELPLVLAGGLTPDTVAHAVARFRPSVVDVSSGVEEVPGIKSPALVRRFIQEARKGSSDAKGVPHA